MTEAAQFSCRDILLKEDGELLLSAADISSLPIGKDTVQIPRKITVDQRRVPSVSKIAVVRLMGEGLSQALVKGLRFSRSF